MNSAITVEELIELVRQLDAARQERAAVVAHLDALDERVSSLTTSIASAMGGAVDDAAPDDDGPDDQKQPRGKAGQVLDMIRAGNFTVYQAAVELYGGDTAEARKNVRSSLRYLSDKLGLIERDGDDWKAVQPT